MVQELKLRESCEAAIELSLSDTLLVDLSRLHLTPKVSRRIRKRMSQGVDWDVFLEAARHHRLRGLLYHHISQNDFSVPTHIVNALDAYLARSKERSNLLNRGVAQLERAFRKIESPVVILKGPVLVHKVYGSSTKRFFYDIDLLTYTDCVSRVEECMNKLGYAHVRIDYMSGRRTVSALEPEEINKPRPISSHRRPMMKKEGTSFNHPIVELHYPKVKLGKMDDDSLIRESDTFDVLGPGLRVLSPEDIVIHTACHFYRHFRLALVTAVASSMGAFITHNSGVLKFLADLYACLVVYFENNGNWGRLLERSNYINATEIIFYGLYYLDLIYGRGTVPGEVFDVLVKNKPIHVPLLNTSPSVRSVKYLLKPEIRTANAVIGPEIWLFNPGRVCNDIVRNVKKWRWRNGAWPNATCRRVGNRTKKNGLPCNAAWQCAEEIVMNQEDIDPTQYFLTHVTGGVWCQHNKLSARVNLLWDDDSLFVRTVAAAEMFHYVEPANIGHGENVSIYVSRISDVPHPIKRISCSIAKEGCVGRPETPEFSSGGWDDLDLGSIQPTVNQSQKGYCLDLRIPWKILEMHPKSGFRFGFDVEVIHKSEAMTLETALAWSGGEFLSEVTSAVHGIVTLVD